MRPIAFAIAIAIALSATPAQAASPLEPASRWQVDFDGAQCMAIRQFASGQERAHLILKLYAMGAGYEISLIQPGSGEGLETGHGTVSIDGAAFDGMAMRFGDPQAGRTVSTWLLSDLSRLAGAETLTVEFEGNEASFSLDQSPQIVAELANCRASLRQAYHIDGQGLEKLPKGDANVFGKLDYASISSDPSAPTRFRALLLLDENGVVSDCALVEHDGDSAVIAQLCAIMSAEVQFKPARDVDGNLVRSPYLTPEIVWSFDKVASNKQRRLEEERERGYADAARPEDVQSVLGTPGDSNLIAIQREPDQ